MSFARQIVSLTGPALAVLLGLSLAAPAAHAQYGLQSGVARVALIARVAPGAAMPQMALSRQEIRPGQTKSLTVSVRLSANTGYRLVVLSTVPPCAAGAPRFWVRDREGVFQPLQAGASVTVLRGERSAGDIQREVSYRLETADAVEDGMPALPVRYEMRLDPII